jgi:hypothetical protein
VRDCCACLPCEYVCPGHDVLVCRCTISGLQEDDRDYLIRQLVAVKKDNARLRQELTSCKEEVEAVKAQVNDNVGVCLLSASPSGEGCLSVGCSGACLRHCRLVHRCLHWLVCGVGSWMCLLASGVRATQCCAAAVYGSTEVVRLG